MISLEDRAVGKKRRRAPREPADETERIRNEAFPRLLKIRTLTKPCPPFPALPGMIRSQKAAEEIRGLEVKRHTLRPGAAKLLRNRNKTIWPAERTDFPLAA